MPSARATYYHPGRSPRLNAASTPPDSGRCGEMVRGWVEVDDKGEIVPVADDETIALFSERKVDKEVPIASIELDSAKKKKAAKKKAAKRKKTAKKRKNPAKG